MKKNQKNNGNADPLPVLSDPVGFRGILQECGIVDVAVLMGGCTRDELRVASEKADRVIVCFHRCMLFERKGNTLCCNSAAGFSPAMLLQWHIPYLQLNDRNDETLRRFI